MPRPLTTLTATVFDSVERTRLEARLRAVLASPEAIEHPHRALARIDAILASETERGESGAPWECAVGSVTAERILNEEWPCED